MIIGSYIKQPVDIIDYDIDYSEWLPSDDSISSATFNISGSEDLSVSSFSINGQVVKVFLAGGVDGESCKIEVTIVTAAGRTKQIEFKVRVRNT
jgi:hypothetical protein